MTALSRTISEYYRITCRSLNSIQPSPTQVERAPVEEFVVDHERLAAGGPRGKIILGS